MRRLGAGWGWRAGLALAAASAALASALGAALPLAAQDSLADSLSNAHQPSSTLRERALPGLLPGKPSSAPAFTIPVEPLGFAPPAVFYLGLGESFVSLDFLDESRLLFTFRVPGLIRRGAGEDD